MAPKRRRLFQARISKSVRPLTSGVSSRGGLSYSSLPIRAGLSPVLDTYALARIESLPKRIT